MRDMSIYMDILKIVWGPLINSPNSKPQVTQMILANFSWSLHKTNKMEKKKNSKLLNMVRRLVVECSIMRGGREIKGKNNNN